MTEYIGALLGIVLLIIVKFSGYHGAHQGGHHCRGLLCLHPPVRVDIAWWDVADGWPEKDNTEKAQQQQDALVDLRLWLLQGIFVFICRELRGRRILMSLLLNLSLRHRGVVRHHL